MKILVLTDIHSDFSFAKKAYLSENPDLVLDCGDHSSIHNLFGKIPHFYIFGNHEPLTLKVNPSVPSPIKIHTGQIIQFNHFGEVIKFSGVDGNYSSKQGQIKVDENSLNSLKKIERGSLDILLLHESPLNVSNSSFNHIVANKILEQIYRINPPFVLSGHSGNYSFVETQNGPNIITLENIDKGYGVLEYNFSKLTFNRKSFKN